MAQKGAWGTAPYDSGCGFRLVLFGSNRAVSIPDDTTSHWHMIINVICECIVGAERFSSRWLKFQSTSGASQPRGLITARWPLVLLSYCLGLSAHTPIEGSSIDYVNHCLVVLGFSGGTSTTKDCSSSSIFKHMGSCHCFCRPEKCTAQQHPTKCPDSSIKSTQLVLRIHHGLLISVCSCAGGVIRWAPKRLNLRQKGVVVGLVNDSKLHPPIRMLLEARKQCVHFADNSSRIAEQRNSHLDEVLSMCRFVITQ